VTNRRHALQQARLYLVCDGIPEARLRAALRGGVQIVQLRLKDADEADILAAGRRMLTACHEHGALLIVNDHPELAARIGADGVHVGQDDVAPVQARAIVGPDRLVGLSTHTPAQVDAAGAEAALDYIGVGPVHATPTKPGRAAVGLELVRYAAAHARLPFFAIGGIDTGNAAAVRGAGAGRIAVVRALTGSPDPERTAAELRAAIGADTEIGVGAA